MSNSVRVVGSVLAAIVIVLHQAVVTGARADDPRQIMEEVQKRNASKTQKYEGLLQSFSGGKTSEKRWTSERLGSYGESKLVIRFTEPAEVRGVALLVVNHPDRASDQWMWTPALERDRRIALQDRSTRFFGTDFSFEDLEERDNLQYDYMLMTDEAVDGKPCWRIASTPKEAKSSQYTRSILWVRKDIYAVVQIESYIVARTARRLEYRNLENIGGIWTARELIMTDARRGSMTRLLLDKIDYNVPLKESDFTLQALRRQ
jgi:outer membrane lipoprotein-sorting protein